MRVVMTSPYSLSRPGGVQGQVLGLARELRKLGVDVRVIGPCDGPPPEPGIVSVGPSVEWNSNGSVAPISPGRATARRTAEVMRSIEPDVVHLHEPAVPGPCLSALLGFNGPMIGTFHASGELLHMWTRPALKSSMARLSSRVVVSESALETARINWYDADYVVLWNGIEVDRFAAATPTPTDRPAAFFIGRHEPRKGLAVLLDAWRTLDRDAVLWVGGSGPQTEELQAETKKATSIEWLGAITDAERDSRLRGATVLCAPSLHGESFGVVLLEGMAAGTAVVASAIEGYANVARADRDALLVPAGDVGALQGALRRLFDDPALRERLVAEGRARADEFSMARLAERYLELYERALVPAR
ncbi:MAG TPA: glycosyltransferase family 4 protein [Acidimicrobiia bacterium]|nr:glycosyltransferase family 4 protein [Acidimicrobiia bacterium]